MRRRLEQPSAEKAKRSGCLTWGAVLGVLVGIMLGIYALPPILKHYYGEKVVAAGETYEGDDKAIRLVDIRVTEIPDSSPGEGLSFVVAHIVVRPDAEWEVRRDHFTLELDGVGDWVQAIALGDAADTVLTLPGGVETNLTVLFPGPENESAPLTPEALHLSEPRVKFEIEQP